MSSTDAIITHRLEALWERPYNLWGWFATVDHKEIGIRYLITAFAFLLVGGIEAILLRLQLAQPDGTVLTPEQYDQIFTMHGVTMIFWYASPILSGFANYLIPLFAGARDMAYSGVGGWMGAVAFPTVSADDPYAAGLGVVGAMRDIKKYTAPGSTVYVFGV